jgi:ATP-dependent Lon protease
LVEGASVDHVVVDAERVVGLLGPHRHRPEVADRRFAPGASVGLCVNEAGGDVLIIEATRMPGKGKIRVTGNMRSVMKESASTALSFVRSRSERLLLDPEWLRTIDLHLHVPRGGSAEDAASAGLAMFVAVATLLLQIPARSDVAVVGELTLRGRVLPVNGVKAMVLAAHRAGLTEVVLPERNQRDLEEVPEEIKRDLCIHLVTRVDEVLPIVLKSGAGRPSTHSSSPPTSSGEVRA